MNGGTIARIMVVVFAGCAGACERSAAPGPPELRLGRDECVECGMTIVDERSAAAFIVDRGKFEEALMFDDIGDMFDHERKHPSLVVVRRYVHDWNTKAWTRAEEAWYIRADAIRTPMASGIAAFASRAAAEAAAREHGVESMGFHAAMEDRARWVERRDARREPTTPEGTP